MSQPGLSNQAQQDQEKASAPDLKTPARQADEIGPRLKPARDGAVQGGEQTKPGQMTGDEDLAPTAPAAKVEKALRGSPSKRT